VIWDLLVRPYYRKLGALRIEEYGGVPGPSAHDLADIRTADGFEPFDTPYPVPRTRQQAVALYGNPGKGTLDRKWERENMVVAENLPGAPLGRLYVHRKAEECLREAMRRSRLACPSYAIERLGCFNFRQQRHDPSRPLSYHAFGVAVDIDPEKNSAKRLSHVECFSDEWYDIWPEGLPQAFIRAWESCGWTWGGRWRPFVDPMHFQLVG
jgi:hypothetical protein